MMETAAATDKYDSIRLGDQLCFPLYACAKEVVRQYRRPLESLGLTYTQYIVMMVLWETGGMTEKELGERVRLDSGTLTPLLKRLEKQGLVCRGRLENDERKLYLTLTEEGAALKEKAAAIPETIRKCMDLSEEEAERLKYLLNKMLVRMEEKQ